MPAGRLRHRAILFLALFSALAVPACGSGSTGGGAGPDGAGQGLILVNFQQASQDNVPINRALEFAFSEPVNPGSIGNGTVQIRQGPSFGLTAAGTFSVDGAVVRFEPQLPTTCGSADAGFQPGTVYRVTVMGDPEEFSVKNTKGQPLESTLTYTFSTRPETDPEFLEDQIPATPPQVTTVSPANSTAAVSVNESNEVVVGFTENIDPCTVSASTVLFQVYEVGDALVENEVPAGEEYAGNKTGFTPWGDQDAADPHTWGSSTGGALPDPQTIPAELLLFQDFDSTQLVIRPGFGRFPENSLCVVQLTFGIQDYGGSPLVPVTFAFTTENLPEQEGVMRVEFDRSTEPWPQDARTADIDTVRSPGLAQGWLLYAGDGDNGGGTDQTPSFPIFQPGFSCAARPNDGTKDDFDPAGNVTLNTGSTRVPSSCTNSTDGSTAVVWEFASFHIRNGVTVTVTGENPAIILVQGSVLIENGAELRARASNGETGNPYGSGTSGSQSPTAKGGSGVAGGADGGDGGAFGDTYGMDGYAGYGSEDYNTPAEAGGLGAGHGNVTASNNTYTYTSPNGNSGGGGGGGHGVAGGDGDSTAPSGMTFADTPDGVGGEIYPDDPSAEALYTPSAGSGGGGAGFAGYSLSYTYRYYYYDGPGGAGGGGGGFVDITSQGDIRIYGTIDVSGGRGGHGGSAYIFAAGGGGGGSGGAVRLLTPADIDVTGGTISAAGGAGGNGGICAYFGSEPNPNDGGAGGAGYICLEDGDSIISGVTTAAMTPPYGSDQCYVGTFDSARFQGGGLEGEATSGPMLVGPLSPVSFKRPVAEDFLAAIPADAAIPPDGTSILIEAAGYPINPDGTVDLTVGDNFHTIGYFYYSGSPNEPAWKASPQATIDLLNGSGYLRFRLTFYLPPGIGAQTPGPWLDWMDLRFTYDQ